MKRLPTLPGPLFETFSVIALLFSTIATAHADPFAAGDPKVGKQLVEQHCTACHVSSFGGDGSGIYTRPDRIVKNANGLIQRIRTCSTNLGLNWFDEDELNVASYLNKSYYKFDK